MASRWLFVRIRAAERALQDGRIDEAYAAALQPDLREHPRGRKLLDELVRPLVARARLHMQAGRFRDGLADLDRVRAAGRSNPEIEELRRRATDHVQEAGQRSANDAAAYARAAANLDAGRLESGRLAIDRVEDSARREALREQLDIRVERSAQLLAQADEALSRRDPLTALRIWQEACERHGRRRTSDEFAQRLAPAVRESLDSAFARGRLDGLLAARAGFANLREFDPAMNEHEQIAGLCARGIEQLASRNYAGLRETLLRLKAARGRTEWIDNLLAVLGRLAEAQDALLASPLGLFASASGKSEAGPVDLKIAKRLDETRAASADQGAATIGSQPLLLLVDGAGSSLLLPRDALRIGRAGGSRPVDVPIPADIQSHHADIVRDGEDYLLTAHGPVFVNQREIKRTRLHDGDRIVLGDAAKMTFHRSSAKSDSAVLRISHRCRLPNDVSEVVLFCETCLIGPQASCHVRTPDGSAQVVLFDRDGKLYGREAAARGGKLGDAKPLRLGQTIDFGDVRVTVKAYELPDGRGNA